MKRTLSVKLTVIAFIITLLAMYVTCTYAGIWTPMTSVGNLNSVWGSSGSDVFAVGGSFGYSDIRHFNGSVWSSTKTGTQCQLNGVWGSSGRDVFAVGGEVGYSGSVILHYNGEFWSSMSNPAYNYCLNAVWGSSGSDVFAVGTYGTIIHYDGTTWSTMKSGTSRFLWSVWGSSGSDVFAVGADYGNYTILHYDGTTWSTMKSGQGPFLTGVWGSSGSDVFVVGYNSISYYGYIYYYNGSDWSSYTHLKFDAYLNSVWGSSGSDVFAVGVNEILHYEETATTTVPPATTTSIPPTVIELAVFYAVSCDSEVKLIWKTESETDNAGFNLYRAEAEGGNYTKINTSVIPSQGTSTQGASYEYIDTGLQNRKTYFYKLEDIDLSGTATMHEPVNATPRLIYGIGK